jgi:cation diffusion facilitator CzcD-associated flavoprotein CzcO
MNYSANKAPPRGTSDHDHATVDVLIVGTGFAGLGMGMKLKRQGDMTFHILERESDVGGTWRDNVYPGVACDVPAPLYSFSFKPNPNWSALFAPGPEIQNYLRDCARDEGLLEHISFNTPMTDARWDAEAELWVVKSEDQIFKAKYFISALGHLSDFELPQLPGLNTFKGDIFHSAAWRDDVSLAGKRVGVIGSGASAIQIVPEVAKVAETLVVFQRSPAYVRPRPVLAFNEEDRRTFNRSPSELAALRERLFWYIEQAFVQRLGVPQFIEEATANALRHLEKQVADPALRKKLTPNYAIGCKRVLTSNDYYPSLTQPHVHVEPYAAASLSETEVISAAGNRFELDAVVFATGFEAIEPPHAELIHSGAGTSLAKRWEQGMQAYASTTVSGYPNLFIINGPNTASGHNSTLFMIESQIEYILGAFKYARDHQIKSLDVSLQAEEAYVKEMDALSEHTVFVSGGCHNWFVDPRSGRNTVKWPDFCYAFRDRNGTFSPNEFLTS